MENTAKTNEQPPSPQERGGGVRLLKLPNYNNCLACDAFIQIHFAPDRPIAERELSQIYSVRINDEDVYLQLVDLQRLAFEKIQSIMTLPATGLEETEWKAWWMQNHPETKHDTPMCIYYYKKKRQPWQT